jgi:coatomer subunit epsilon
MNQEPDELYTLRNLFWLGNYQLAINEANSIKRCPSNLLSEKTEFMYRSYTAMGQYDIVISEVSDESSLNLRGVKLLAQVLSGVVEKDVAIVQFQEWLNDVDASNIATLQLLLSILYSQEGGATGANISEAIKIIHTGATMEQMAMLVQLYIRLDRLEYALKQVAKMKNIDEDGTLSMLAQGWCHLSTLPSTKAQEAGYIFEELGDKYGSSALLLNAQAVAKMHQQQFDEAESLLTDAMQKSPNDAETLANLIVTGQHLGREVDVTNRYLNQLKKVSPQHPLLASLAVFEQAFDRVGRTLAV